MTTAIEPTLSETTYFKRILIPSLLAAAGTMACRWAAGPTLGLFFGAFFVVTFLAPAAGLIPARLSQRLLSVAAIAMAVALVTLFAVFQSADTFVQWLEFTAALLAYAAFVAGIAAAVSRAGLPAILASALAIVIGIAWLTWPIWLAPHLAAFSPAEVNLLVNLHPPLEINGVLASEPAWTERSLAYHLTNLNQDVPIRLPHSAAMCVVGHLVLAVLLWIVAAIPCRPLQAAAVRDGSR